MSGQYVGPSKTTHTQVDRVEAHAAKLMRGQDKKYLSNGALYKPSQARQVEAYLSDKCQTKLTIGEVIARCSKEPGHQGDCWPNSLVKIAEAGALAPLEEVPSFEHRGIGW